MVVVSPLLWPSYIPSILIWLAGLLVWSEGDCAVCYIRISCMLLCLYESLTGGVFVGGDVFAFLCSARRFHVTPGFAMNGGSS